MAAPPAVCQLRLTLAADWYAPHQSYPQAKKEEKSKYYKVGKPNKDSGIGRSLLIDFKLILGRKAN